MAVKIRLKRMGKIRAPYYRIVVADSRTKRDGKTIEEIGKYHPKLEPSLIEVDSDRVQHWLTVGAQPTEPVLAILQKTGDWQKFKGEPAPEPLKVAAAKADKRTMFDEALREAHAEPDTEAVSQSQKKTRKSAKSDKGEKAEKKPERPEKKSDKADKADKSDKADKAEKAAPAEASAEPAESGESATAKAEATEGEG